MSIKPTNGSHLVKQTQPARIEDARDWTPLLHRYREPDHLRSMLEILITAVPFIVLWVLMWASLSLSYWLSLIIAVPAASLLVRLFMIQHDCGHGTFFRHRWANDWVGRAIGVLTLTPYDHWRRSHAIRFPPKATLALGIALHELATNAVKYGAFSNDRGSILIRWRIEPTPRGDRLILDWQEKGGPPVSPPSRKGFGSQVIERGLGHELHGSAHLDYQADGVVCTINIPAPRGARDG
jgi:hypothetical protein